MIKLVPFFAVLAVAAAAQVYDVDDLDNSLDSDLYGEADTRMAGGNIVDDGKGYSFMIGIQPRYPVNGVDTRAPLCSGVLIKGYNSTLAATQYFVLTSAHCALSGTVYDLYAGSTKITNQKPNDTVSANLTIVNDEYRQAMLTGDVAIIPTTIDPSKSNGQVTVATLASINDATKSYLINTVTMAGWGYPNDAFTVHSPSLRELNSWVVPNWYCQLRHLTLPIKKTHMCTAGLPNKGPCTGDSGAPLIAHLTSNSDGNAGGDRVIGLATHTPQDGCNRGKPGVFTRIGDYLAWISLVTNYYEAEQE